METAVSLREQEEWAEVSALDPERLESTGLVEADPAGMVYTIYNLARVMWLWFID